MALNHSPSIVTTNLLLNLDFKNPKIFDTFGTNLVTHPNYNPSTWGIGFVSYKKSGIDAPDGSNTAVRVTGKVIAGTYTLTSNVATITSPNHGLSNGSNQYIDFASGTAPDGYYVITVVDANTFTVSATSADTSGAVIVRCRSGMRISLTPFTPNGTDTYILSFWARLIYAGSYGATGFAADLTDGSPYITYTSQLVENQWVHVVTTGVPSNASKSWLDLVGDQLNDFVIDLWGVKLENLTLNNSYMTLKDNVGGYTFNLHRPNYSTQNIDSITFTRNAVAPKWGGVIRTTGTGPLTSANFLYNDHTWEVWFRIDDITPTNIPTYEGMSCLAMYAGYHCGFYYSATRMDYLLWNSTTAVLAASWTVGTTGAQINQGQWYQIAVVRSGDTFTPYLNGVGAGVGTTNATAVLAGITNNIHLGACANLAAGAGDFLNYAKNTVGNMKMYNRALTADEIRQNFNAFKGRYGL